jgi:putative selenium metabolism hydrolase
MLHTPAGNSRLRGCALPGRKQMKLTTQQISELTALTVELVRAESPAGREGAAAAVVVDWMHRLHYDEITVDRYGSIIGVIRGAHPGPILLFDGHLDVVPATAREAWHADPFGGAIVDGRIYGRGATDMKGPDAAMIYAAALVDRAQLHGAIVVSMSVAEEELEGAALRSVLQMYPADYVIIGEMTNNRLGMGQKGRAGIRVETRGLPAHSSRPEQGRNAVYLMIEAVERLRRLPMPPDALLGPGVQELVEIVSSPFPGTSIVPDLCRVRFDRRTVIGETAESVLAELRAALADLPDATVAYLDVTVPCYTGAQLAAADFHGAWLAEPHGLLAETARAVLRDAGLPVEPFYAPYCTNGSTSAAELDIPTIILGPSDPALAHTIDESIAIADLVQGCELYAVLSSRLLSA